MVNQVEMSTVRSGGIFVPPTSSAICYCGVVVVGRLLCPDCSERMSRALRRPLLEPLELENAG